MLGGGTLQTLEDALTQLANLDQTPLEDLLATLNSPGISALLSPALMEFVSTPSILESPGRLFADHTFAQLGLARPRVAKTQACSYIAVGGTRADVAAPRCGDGGDKGFCSLFQASTPSHSSVFPNKAADTSISAIPDLDAGTEAMHEDGKRTHDSLVLPLLSPMFSSFEFGHATVPDADDDMLASIMAAGVPADVGFGSGGDAADARGVGGTKDSVTMETTTAASAPALLSKCHPQHQPQLLPHGHDEYNQHEGGGKAVALSMKGDYRGGRHHPLDRKLLGQFSSEDLRLTGRSWKTLLASVALTAEETVRVKQLHRRELCKGYSKDSRSRVNEKQKAAGGVVARPVPVAEAARGVVARPVPVAEAQNLPSDGQVRWLKTRVADLESLLAM
jgi:hypothetical protein